MSGNVWEWCQDRYASDYYTNSPAEDPGGPASGPDRVVRGGSCGFPAGDVRTANRDFTAQSSLSAQLGFRLSRTGP